MADFGARTRRVEGRGGLPPVVSASPRGIHMLERFAGLTTAHVADACVRAGVPVRTVSLTAVRRGPGRGAGVAGAACRKCRRFPGGVRVRCRGRRTGRGQRWPAGRGVCRRPGRIGGCCGWCRRDRDLGTASGHGRHHRDRVAGVQPRGVADRAAAARPAAGRCVDQGNDRRVDGDPRTTSYSRTRTERSSYRRIAWRNCSDWRSRSGTRNTGRRTTSGPGGRCASR